MSKYEDYLVYMDGITVEFPGVKALDQVSFNLKRGEVHVLLGENGAGKSTLIKVLSGVNKTVAGTVYIEGREAHLGDTREAIREGINIIYQELNLVPYLTVAENIFLGEEPRIAGIVKWKQLFSDAQEILDHLHVDIDSRQIVRKLGIAQQQTVEVAKALRHKAKVIIMDEPTSALTDHEINELFAAIARLKSEGVGIIYISHRLEEVKAVGDRVTVLRDGQYVDTLQVQDSTVDQYIRLMVGRDITDKFPKEKVAIGETILTVDGVSTKDKLKNCSLSVRKGEILGLAGLMGAGRTELCRAIYGADPIVSGTITLNDRVVRIRRPSDAVKNKIGLLPEDRKAHGLVLDLSVRINVSLANVGAILKRGLLSFKKEKAVARSAVEKLAIKTPGLNQKVKLLSGGNQQKVVVGKWLMTDSVVLIFDEPTRGIDVGAKIEIYKIMTEFAKNGFGIIMVSSEL
ncbi:MAG: sugar ABC transporter ATP-binding protein, partial [Spirochaetaceae bacterium]|nr:sugar ABC transporter ATP-binding protein [Spirochaetaceae bacterium]